MSQPVNWVPPEILSRIARDIPDDGAQDASSMVPLTQVCRYWRESIISTPENWTLISTRSRSLATVSLERAKSALLEINLGPSFARGGRWLSDLLIPHIQNIKTLSFRRLSVVELKSGLPNFPQSMPNLRSLTLAPPRGAGWDRFTDPFGAFPPTMRCLKLLGISLYPSLLELRTLTELDLRDLQCSLHLDTLLGFFEENCFLKSAALEIRFAEPALRIPRRQTPIRNRLQYLRITCPNAMDGRALISSISLSKGAELTFTCWPSSGVTANDVLSDISTTHLSNLPSPTFMEYRVNARTIRLLGPNGTAAFHNPVSPDLPFVEFLRLPLTNIRRLHLDTSCWDLIRPPPGPAVFHHLTLLPTLETLAIRCNTDLSRLLSALFSDPSSSPSLKTLTFSDCIITEEFMEELTRFASDRKNTTSARLHGVSILDCEGKFPNIASIRKLKEHVPAVDVRIAEELPVDLT